MRRPGPDRRRYTAGFTLAEMLLVLVLLAVISAVMAPMLVNSPARQVKANASELAAALRETRRHAQASQQRSSFRINTETGLYRGGGMRERRIGDEALNIELTTARSLLDSDEQGRIDFFPDGSSTGGRLALSIDEWSIRIDVEWLTGRIRVRDAAK